MPVNSQSNLKSAPSAFREKQAAFADADTPCKRRNLSDTECCFLPELLGPAKP